MVLLVTYAWEIDCTAVLLGRDVFSENSLSTKTILGQNGQIHTLSAKFGDDQSLYQHENNTPANKVCNRSRQLILGDKYLITRIKIRGG